MPTKVMFQTALADVWTDAASVGDKAGDVRWEGGKAYKCVQYNSGAGAVAAIAGRVASYYAPGGDHASPNGYASNKVTMDISDSALLGAGVLQAVPTNGQYGWVQLRGGALLTVALASGGDGDPLANLGAADTGTLTVSAAATDHVCAYADDASARIIICDFPF